MPSPQRAAPPSDRRGLRPADAIVVEIPRARSPEHSLSPLIERWERQAHAYAEDGALVRGDALLRRVAAEFEAGWAAWQNEALSLQEASRESGYSADHLARLVRDGALPNAGDWRAPRILRRDLLRKPGHGVGTATPTATVVLRSQIVRSVVESETEDDDG